MKYKVGNKVRIKSIDWYNENKDNSITQWVNLPDGTIFGLARAKFCDQIMTIEDIKLDSFDTECEYYLMMEDKDKMHWNDYMIEGLAEEEMSLDKAGQITDFEYEGLAYTLPDGYIFKDENGNEILTSKIILEKKKKEYPKTYEECVGKLSINWDGKVEGYKCDLLAAFQKLLICRDVYWTIAGEEIWNTSKPWNPNCHGEDKYTIEYYDGVIIRASSLLDNRILAFPTAEMRDAFKENFKELIEICKELL